MARTKKSEQRRLHDENRIRRKLGVMELAGKRLANKKMKHSDYQKLSMDDKVQIYMRRHNVGREIGSWSVSDMKLAICQYVYISTLTSYN